MYLYLKHFGEANNALKLKSPCNGAPLPKHTSSYKFSFIHRVSRIRILICLIPSSLWFPPHYSTKIYVQFGSVRIDLSNYHYPNSWIISRINRSRNIEIALHNPLTSSKELHLKTKHCRVSISTQEPATQGCLFISIIVESAGSGCQRPETWIHNFCQTQDFGATISKMELIGVKIRFGLVWIYVPIFVWTKAVPNWPEEELVSVPNMSKLNRLNLYCSEPNLWPVHMSTEFHSLYSINF